MYGHRSQSNTKSWRWQNPYEGVIKFYDKINRGIFLQLYFCIIAVFAIHNL